MPPPPIPFFRAPHVTAAEEDGLLVIRPRGGLVFSEPPATSALYLPFARLVDVAVVPYEGGAAAAVRFRGEFSRVSRESPLFVGELPAADAEALAQALQARYGLPREPTPRRASELRSAPWDEYIAVVGTYAPGHFEVADFEGAMLHCADELRPVLAPGRRFYVEGFVDPGARPGAMIVGYGGPTLKALRVTEYLRPDELTGDHAAGDERRRRGGPLRGDLGADLTAPERERGEARERELADEDGSTRRS